MRSVPVLLMALFGVTAPPPAAPPPCLPAELFATDNTGVLTDPDSAQLHDGLQLFEAQADATITQSGATVTGSTLLDGVSWPAALQRPTHERSREFHVCAADGSVHTAAEALRRQFRQQTVLIFDYLPQQAPDADAILLTAPGIDVIRFGEALVADPAAHHRLPTGSITATEHTLILVAGAGDLDTARRLVGEAGGDLDTTTIAYGRRELVET